MSRTRLTAEHRAAVLLGESFSTDLGTLKRRGGGKVITERECDEPDGGMVLATVPHTPAANAVFTAAELARRIAYYAARAKRRHALFTFRAL